MIAIFVGLLVTGLVYRDAIISIPEPQKPGFHVSDTGATFCECTSSSFALMTLTGEINVSPDGIETVELCQLPIYDCVKDFNDCKLLDCGIEWGAKCTDYGVCNYAQLVCESLCYSQLSLCYHTVGAYYVDMIPEEGNFSLEGEGGCETRCTAEYFLCGLQCNLEIDQCYSSCMETVESLSVNGWFSFFKMFAKNMKVIR